MNNKSDKKHKRKQKKPKTKKKTTKITQSKKKNEIQSGGMWPFSFRSFFSRDNQSQSNNLLPQNQLSSGASQNPQPANPNNSQQTASQNPQPANSNNSQRNVSQPSPPSTPNVKPQGLNTIKSTSRCSIM